ncbi:MAG: TlpA family protein disulfide reductase [Candidatus Eisenbacteria bacterium]|nr:TlpA family protein disulfide reductase [Candidatus Eisenbacteria bacterium]
MRSLPLALLAAVSACLIGAFGCSPAGRPADGGSSGAAAAPDSAGPPVMPAEVGEILARAKSPGAQATLVNVWATWCGPCREEFPGMLAVARRHPGLRVVLVSADFDAQLGA